MICISVDCPTSSLQQEAVSSNVFGLVHWAEFGTSAADFIHAHKQRRFGGQIEGPLLPSQTQVGTSWQGTSRPLKTQTATCFIQGDSVHCCSAPG